MGKARTDHLYPMLKDTLRGIAPDLVPYNPNSVMGDKAVYSASRKAIEPDIYGRENKWPRMCKILVGYDGDDPYFYYTKPCTRDEDEVPSVFVQYVEAIAEWADIPVTPPLPSYPLHLSSCIFPRILSYLPRPVHPVPLSGGPDHGQPRGLVRVHGAPDRPRDQAQAGQHACRRVHPGRL